MKKIRQQTWEQRKLGDIIEAYSGGTPSSGNKTYYGGDIPFIRSGEVNSDCTELFITERGLKDSSAKLVEKGDILYALYGATSGEVGISKVNGAINQAILAIKPKSGDNSYLITQWLKKQKNTILSTYLQGGQGNLSGNIVKSLAIDLPRDKEEQEKIGLLFKHLDNTIALHQRKLEHLRTLKTTFLQQMIPSGTAKVPRVRFANFTDSWEQRKLSDILNERNEQMPENEDYPLMSFVQHVGVKPKNERYDRSFLVIDKNKKYKKTEFGDFIYSSNNLDTGSIGFNRTGKAVISPVYSIFSSNNNVESQFIGLISNKKEFINSMIRYRQGVVYGQWRIHESEFLNIKIRIPSIEEQTEILKHFQNLDKYIDIHQNKLDSLRTLKQAYLQKMFI